MKLYPLILPVLALSLAFAPPMRAQEAETPEAPLAPTQAAAAENWINILQENDLEAARAAVKMPGFDPLLRLRRLYNNALGAALSKEHPEIALLMVEAAPNDAYLSDNEVLYSLAKRENIEVLKAFLAKPKFDVNAKVYEKPLLARLSESSNEEGVKLLLARPELDAMARDSKGRTALHAANDARSKSIVMLLLADGRIDPNAVDNDGNTALHLAADFGDVEVLKGIAGDKRTKGNLLNKKGESPLFIAASSDMELVEVLMASKKVEVSAKENAQIAKLKAAGGHAGGNAAG